MKDLSKLAFEQSFNLNRFDKLMYTKESSLGSNLVQILKNNENMQNNIPYKVLIKCRVYKVIPLLTVTIFLLLSSLFMLSLSKL